MCVCVGAHSPSARHYLWHNGRKADGDIVGDGRAPGGTVPRPRRPTKAPVVLLLE